MGRIRSLSALIAISASVSFSSLGAVNASAGVRLLEQGTVAILGATEGSGALVFRNNDVYTVATVWHVVSSNSQGEELWVRTSDGQSHIVDSSSVTRLGSLDLAILKFKSTSNYPVLPVSRIDLPASGMMLISAGRPLNRSAGPMQISVGELIASSGAKIDSGYSLLYTNKTLPGMSGGPIVNKQNQLVGLHGRGERNKQTGSVAMKTGINQGIPAYFIRQYLSGLPVSALSDELSTCGDYLAASNMSHSHAGGAMSTYRLANAAFQTCPDKSKPLFLMAYSSWRLGNRKESIRFYEQSLDYDPSSLEARVNLVNVKIEDALINGTQLSLSPLIEELRKVHGENPRHVGTINTLALAYFLSGQKDSAVALLRKGLKIDPTSELLRNNLKSFLGKSPVRQ